MYACEILALRILVASSDEIVIDSSVNSNFHVTLTEYVGPVESDCISVH